MTGREPKYREAVAIQKGALKAKTHDASWAGMEKFARGIAGKQKIFGRKM